MRQLQGLFLVLCLIFSGTAVSKPTDTHLNRANTAEPESLDPQLVHTLPGMRITGDMFDGLVHRNPAGSIVPAQASHWKTSPDGLTWTFTLRKSQWSDGHPVTATDFVNAWRRAVDPKTGSPYAWYLEMMGLKNAKAITQGQKKTEHLGVSAPNASTLKISLEQPTPWLLEMLVLPVLYPVPSEAIKQYGNRWTQPDHIVTNGPYRLKNWTPNEKITLAANQDYPDYSQLNVQSVTYYPLPSASAAYNRFRAGDLDMTLNIPTNYYRNIKETIPGELRVTHTLGTEYYAFNNARPPFDNAKLRRALSLALERNKITDKVLGEGQIPAYSFTPAYMANMPIYKNPAEDMTRKSRLAEARRLYKEAGYSKENPLRFTLLYNTSESRQKVALAASSMWKQNLGAVVTLENMEWKSVVAKIRQRDFDVARASWVADFNDPVSMLAIFASDSSSNKASYKNSQYDALLSKLNKPGANRQNLFIQMENKLAEEAPVAPLYHYVSPSLVSPKVKGWYDNPRELIMTRYLSVNPNAQKN